MMTSRYTLLNKTPILKVPADFPVGFALLTHEDVHYVVCYDAERQMTIGACRVGESDWDFQKLPSVVEWDSHNYVTMAIDRDGHLHVSGNMHCVPLVYFRTETPGDIQSLKQLPMTGEVEDRVTYPEFLKDHEGRLVFTYRDGSSGNGSNLYNVYDEETQSWSRLLDSPLFDGRGACNAYPEGPVSGPDGYFHIIWVWRDTPDCDTNHHLSYARSKDLIYWETAGGASVDLPLVSDEPGLWVDPIPTQGGIINGCERLAFDSQNRPMISYHKADENGKMQIVVARFEDGEWVRHVVTDWSEPVPFSGRGSMGFIGIQIGDLECIADGVLGIDFHHKDYGRGTIQIDAETLVPLEDCENPRPNFPDELNEVEGEFDGLLIKRTGDIGGATDVTYMLQWETLTQNHDKPRTGELPEPSQLYLLMLEENA